MAQLSGEVQWGGRACHDRRGWQQGFVCFVSEQTQYNLLSRVAEMEGREHLFFDWFFTIEDLTSEIGMEAGRG